MPERSFEELMHGYVNNQLTDKETEYFMALVQQPAYKEKAEAYIGNLLEKRSVSGLSNEIQGQAVFQKIMTAADAHNQLPETNTIAGKRFVWMKYAAAAAVLIAFLSLTYVWSVRSTGKKVTAQQQKEHPYKNDVSPGTQKALLTLGDGSVIELDDAQNGTLASQGGTKVIKLDGSINYENSKSAAQQTLYNTIATPRGGQYQVVLPDGTLVWLNAASSIHFPTRFTGNERNVEITGEAYFEVKKDTNKPFNVYFSSSNGGGREGAVQVLGTHFNINAYDDEETIKTTLLEGSVKITKDAASAILKPGQQATLSHTSQSSHNIPVQTADVDAVMAWKNGQFQFNNADIQTIIRQLARWYNLEVQYNKAPDDNLYYVEMPRNSKLSSILKVLELTGNIHFEIEGNKLIVS